MERIVKKFGKLEATGWVFLLLPVYLVRIPLPGAESASLNLLDLLILVAIGDNVWRLGWADFWRGARGWWRENRSLGAALVLITAGFFGSYLINFNSENWTTGLGALKSFLVLPMLLALTWQIRLRRETGNIQERLTWNNIFYPLLALAGFLSLVGLGALLLGSPGQGGLTFDGRLELWWDSPNHLAMALSSAILIVSFCLLRVRPGRVPVENKKWFSIPPTPLSRWQAGFTKRGIAYTTLLLVLLVALVKAESGGAVGAVLLVVVIMLLSEVFRFKNKVGARSMAPLKWLGGLVVFLSVVVLGLILSSGFLAQWSNYQPVSPPTSWDSRVAIYRAASWIWATDYHWLTGIGPGNFQAEYLAAQPHFERYPQWAVPHAHNNWMHVWLEGGVLAGLGFGLLGAFIFGKFWCCRLRFTFTVPVSTAQVKPRRRLKISSKMKALFSGIIKSKVIEEVQVGSRSGNKKTALGSLGNETAGLASLIVVYFLLHGLVDVTIWHNDMAVIFWMMMGASKFFTPLGDHP